MNASTSLIITTYNRAQYLSAAIESVLAQTYCDFSLLIWDDGSTDRSVKIAEQYAKKDQRIRVVASSHQGIAPTLKAAVAATSSDYIGWVDSDDMLASTALEETISVLNNYPQVGLVYTKYQIMDSDGNLHRIGQRCQIPYSKERLLVDFMTFHFRLIRRTTYDLVGGIDPTFVFGEDYDLCLKLSEVTDVQHIAKPLYYYRRHSSNFTNDQFESIRWAHKAISNALKRRGLDIYYELDMHLTAHFEIKLKHHVTTESKRPNDQKVTVSIIITSDNIADRITACLQKCRQQTHPLLEIIVVDNNSTNSEVVSTAEIVKQYAETSPHSIRLLFCPQPGTNHARNYGFHHANGDYIQWLDADDELDPDKIALQVAALEQNLDGDIAYSDWHWCLYDHQRLTRQFTFTNCQYDDFLFQLLMDNWQPSHAYLLRKSAAQRLQQVQLTHPQTTSSINLEYFTIAAILGLRFLYVPGAIVYYNYWSSMQNSSSTLCKEQIQSRKQMAKRFQHYAMEREKERMGAEHWFLLKLNWDFWQIVPTLLSQETERCFWLKHHSTNFGMTITPAEARIVLAMNQLGAINTLMGHTNQIVRLLWKQVAPEREIESANVTEALSRYVGLLPDSQPFTFSEKPLLSQTIEAATEHALIRDVPAHAPLFTLQRFAIIRLLDKLRVAGLLEKVTPETD